MSKGGDAKGRIPRDELSAADRAHGTHGRGDAREQLQEDTPTLAGNSGTAETGARSREWADGQTGKLSDAAWGNAASGGSVIDKRSPKKSTEHKRKKKG